MEKYHWFKTDWHVKFEKSMQVNSLCERIRQACSRAMRMLVEYFDNPPNSSPRKNSSTTLSIARMSAVGLLPPYGSAMSASSSFSSVGGQVK